MKKDLADKEYNTFLLDIKDRIRQAQYSALKAVNSELILLYWSIGEMIVAKQESAGWGKSVVENLARDLQNEFLGMKGFSVQNLWYMRQFYIKYRDNVKLQPLVGEISWTKNLVILSKCKNDLEREFYIRMTCKLGWTKDVLINNIENRSYEKYLMNQTNFDSTIPNKYQAQAKLAVKDEYTFDFLELSEQHSESDLEKALVNRIRKFLSEMGGDFCFIGNQYRLEIDGEEYFIDLLLYHRKLNCLIAIELKIGKFKPEYAGKMQFYLAALNDTVRTKAENSSIGIIICKQKNRTTVEYALQQIKQPIGVSTYKITPSLPENISRYLPSEKDIAKSIERLGSGPMEEDQQ